MKKQIGIWVDATVWLAYKELCGKEKFRPAEPIEKFLQLVLREKSVMSILRWMDMAGKAEGFEAYVRVLLDWYRNGKLWVDVTDEDEAPIEPMLLEVLKHVMDPKLRREIKEALTKTQEKRSGN